MPVSAKVAAGMVEGSWIRRMFEEGIVMRQKYGDANVFDLSIGNPVVEPPEQFTETLKQLTANPVPGMHRYMENAGYPETRAAVAAYLAKETGLKFTFDCIVMTCGAAAAINIALKAILNAGEEVVVFLPYFVDYLNYILNHDGVPKLVPTDDRFQPDLKALEAAIGPKTRAVLICSPNNPTGVVYSRQCLDNIGRIMQAAEKRFGTQIYLVCDEPYRRIIYDGLVFPQIWPAHQRSIVVYSHSKDLALPGERIGYVAIHPDCPDRANLVQGFIFCNRVLGFINAPALMQRAVQGLQGVSVSVADYQAKRDLLYMGLVEAGYSVLKPQGAFYMFPKSPIDDEVLFIRELQARGVLAVPGRGFGVNGYFRVSYCVDNRTIEGSLDGLRFVAGKFGLKPA